MTIDFETYLNNLRNINTWFDMFENLGGEEMIAETKAFILEAPYQELISQSYGLISREVEEGVLVNRCRQYSASTCLALLELGFLIENLYDIGEARRKMEQEGLEAMWDDHDSRWSDLDDHEVDDGETVPADPHWAEAQEY